MIRALDIPYINLLKVACVTGGVLATGFIAVAFFLYHHRQDVREKVRRNGTFPTSVTRSLQIICGYFCIVSLWLLGTLIYRLYFDLLPAGAKLTPATTISLVNFLIIYSALVLPAVLLIRAKEKIAEPGDEDTKPFNLRGSE